MPAKNSLTSKNINHNFILAALNPSRKDLLNIFRRYSEVLDWDWLLTFSQKNKISGILIDGLNSTGITRQLSDEMQNEIIEMVYASHPFDVVGYDGYNYPYAFSIHDFEPITGRIHQPPPVHQTFETDTFVVCSFVPRLYDYHPDAIPAPYNHSNIDSDEVLYYVDGDFMSRNDVEAGHISLHPAGIPHGPHPGATERSIGKIDTKELAVMVDTFKPLQVTEEALKISDGDYYQSWLE